MEASEDGSTFHARSCDVDDAAKVYVVTKGCYSSYRICAIFSTHDKAVEYLDRFVPSDEWAIEARPLDASFPGQGMTAFVVEIHGNGNVHSCVRSDGDLFIESGDYVNWYDDEKSRVLVECYARDEAHAIKIATERRQAWLARQAVSGG